MENTTDRSGQYLSVASVAPEPTAPSTPATPDYDTLHVRYVNGPQELQVRPWSGYHVACRRVIGSRGFWDRHYSEMMPLRTDPDQAEADLTAYVRQHPKWARAEEEKAGVRS